MTMDPSTNGHDAHLVAAISGGDRGALETVYTDHKDDLLSAAYHLLGDRAAAEDVLQETFLFNATIRENITVGDFAAIGAASILLADVPARQIWAGNPAHFIREIKD